MNKDGEFGSRKPPMNSSSWSFTDDESVSKYDHVWSIANFDTKMRMENGQSLKSGTFSVEYKGNSTDWCLELFPNGYELNKGYVSLFLRKTNSTPDPVEVEAFFYIVDQQGDKGTPRNRTRHIYRNKDDYFGNEGTSKRFINHNYINLPTNNTFTVLCEMSILGEPVVSNGTNKSRLLSDRPSSSNSLNLDMCSFFESGKFSDCIVTCGDEEFKCHKVILAGRSSVFNAMFSNDMRENVSSKVVIEDLGKSTVAEMIHYIYSGNVENLNGNAKLLISAADKYDLSELKAICESHLAENLTVENVGDTLILAHAHNSTLLQDAALQFVSEKGEKVLNQMGFRDKLKSYPDLLMKMFEAAIKK